MRRPTESNSLPVSSSACPDMLDVVFPTNEGNAYSFAARASEFLVGVLSQPATSQVVRDVGALVPLLCVLSRRLSAPDLVDGLLAAAQIQYQQGASYEGLEPADEAVRVARANSSPSLLRKALTFRGTLRADTSNHAGALEDYSDALDLLDEAGEPYRAPTLWNNLGCIYVEMLLFGEAAGCFNRVVALERSRRFSDPTLANSAARAFTNLATICLNEERWSDGLDYVAEARLLMGIETLPGDLITLCIMESVAALLLLGEGRVAEARACASRSKQLAAESGTRRSTLEAAIPLALCDVYDGFSQEGLAALDQAVREARPSAAFVRDALRAAVKGNEKAGRPEIALSYLRELMAHTNHMQREAALRRRHLRLVDSLVGGGALPQGDVAFRERQLCEVLSRKVAGRRREGTIDEVLEQLAVTAELRDDSSGQHPFRVGQLAALCAVAARCSDEETSRLELVCRLHDIGKISIPDAILMKPGPLSDGERELMQEHCQMGEELIRQCEIDDLNSAAEVARSHHENWDGTGYPDQLKGEAIPFAARVTALAETFDALTHDRPHRPAISAQEALGVIADGRGTRFDPVLTDHFVALVTRLLTEVDDLDAYLGRDAQQSTFLRARARIAAALSEAPCRPK